MEGNQFPRRAEGMRVVILMKSRQEDCLQAEMATFGILPSHQIILGLGWVRSSMSWAKSASQVSRSEPLVAAEAGCQGPFLGISAPLQ